MAILSPPAMSTLNQSVFMYATILTLASVSPKRFAHAAEPRLERLLPPSQGGSLPMPRIEPFVMHSLPQCIGKKKRIKSVRNRAKPSASSSFRHVGKGNAPTRRRHARCIVIVAVLFHGNWGRNAERCLSPTTLRRGLDYLVGLLANAPQDSQAPSALDGGFRLVSARRIATPDRRRPRRRSSRWRSPLSVARQHCFLFRGARGCDGLAAGWRVRVFYLGNGAVLRKALDRTGRAGLVDDLAPGAVIKLLHLLDKAVLGHALADPADGEANVSIVLCLFFLGNGPPPGTVGCLASRCSTKGTRRPLGERGPAGNPRHLRGLGIVLRSHRRSWLVGSLSQPAHAHILQALVEQVAGFFLRRELVFLDDFAVLIFHNDLRFDIVSIK